MSCSKYAIINHQTKRAIQHCRYVNPTFCVASACGCPTNNLTCHTCSVSLPPSLANGSEDMDITWNSNNTADPFAYSDAVSSSMAYKISCYGHNQTSFSNCLPTTVLTVECTGLLVGMFPETQINLTDFSSSAVDGVVINTEIDATTGDPNALELVFYDDASSNLVSSGYTGGVCNITIQIGSSSKTYDLIKSGLTDVGWNWDSSTGTWFSQLVVSLPTQKVVIPNTGGTLYYNIKVELNWTLNANTDNSKGQTWLQMNGKLSYSYPISGEATVAGQMTAISIYDS